MPDLNIQKNNRLAKDLGSAFKQRMQDTGALPEEQALPEAPPVDRYAADKAAARQLEALFQQQNAQPQVAPPMPDPELAAQEEIPAVEPVAAPMLSPVAAPVMQQALDARMPGQKRKVGVIR